jgi:hypothetical protein
MGNPDLVDIERVAARLLVKRETVRMWRHREILPDPEWYLNGGPIWRWETIERWAKETGRL